MVFLVLSKCETFLCVPIEFARGWKCQKCCSPRLGACVSDIEGGHIVCDSFCLIGFSSLLATCGKRGCFDDDA